MRNRLKMCRFPRGLRHICFPILFPILISGAWGASTSEEYTSAWRIFLTAKDNIVAQCIYRPKPEDVVWGAMDGLARDLGPGYAKFFPAKRTGTVQEALDGFQLSLLQLDAECNLPFRTLVAQSIRAYCRTLDRHSDYDDYVAWAKLHEARKFNYVGIGVTLVDRMTEGFILNPFPDGPADRAGIVGGDFLVAVNGNPVRGMSKEEVLSLCAGRAGTKVSLKVRHADRTIEEIDVIREKVDTSPLVIGQTATGIRVACSHNISDQAVEDFRKLLRSRRPGEELTLDLRGCGGGTVTAAVNMASLFLPPDTTIGKLEAPSGQEKLISTNNSPYRPSKLTILQDRFTASAAELVIAALVGNRIFPVETRGERTYGKGLAQMQVELVADASGPVAGILVITDTRIYGPNNEVWDGEGLAPTAGKK